MKKWIAENSNKIVIIANAKDQYTDKERVEQGTLNDIAQLEKIGFDVSRLDLKDYFGKKEELEEYLQRFQASYVVGGNTFVLRRAMKMSGFDECLIERIKDDKFLYAGYSAGICVLSKDITGIAVMDEPEIDPYDYGSVIYEGIGLLDYTPIPHYNSDHAETELADKAVEFCEKNCIKYKTLRDGEVFLEDTNKQIDFEI